MRSCQAHFYVVENSPEDAAVFKFSSSLSGLAEAQLKCGVAQIWELSTGRSLALARSCIVFTELAWNPNVDEDDEWDLEK